MAAALETDALLGADATREAVVARASDADLIYLATHGVADPDRPLYGSFVALAQGGWNAGDVLASKLQAKLVVLSACQTGLGMDVGGGTIGLARSFYLSGAPRVVMSLWNVDDNGTKQLMGAFFATCATSRRPRRCVAPPTSCGGRVRPPASGRRSRSSGALGRALRRLTVVPSPSAHRGATTRENRAHPGVATTTGRKQRVQRERIERPVGQDSLQPPVVPRVQEPIRRCDAHAQSFEEGGGEQVTFGAGEWPVDWHRGRLAGTATHQRPLSPASRRLFRQSNGVGPPRGLGGAKATVAPPDAPSTGLSFGCPGSGGVPTRIAPSRPGAHTGAPIVVAGANDEGFGPSRSACSSWSKRRGCSRPGVTPG